MPNGGGAMNRCSSVLSPDGKYLLVAAASSVRVYSSVTAEIVHSLYGHTQEVTAIVLHHGSNDLVCLMPYKPQPCSKHTCINACALPLTACAVESHQGQVLGV